MLKIFIFYCCCLLIIEATDFPSSRWARAVDTEWHGNWFPQDPKVVDNNPMVEYEPTKSIDIDMDADHRVPMGVINDICDNAKANLTIDWNNSPVDYTCFEEKWNFLPKADVHPILHCDHIPAYYVAHHICMNTSIEYDELIPTFGPHRPLWAKYGEYLFLPKQRWVHNLEHGAVVMLYHPCANKMEVQLLKNIVRKCLYRHIITPSTLLSPDRPLALITWGCRFTMSKVDPNLVLEYIAHAALQGPEIVSRDGQFDSGLIHPAGIVSDADDSNLCPNLV